MLTSPASLNFTAGLEEWYHVFEWKEQLLCVPTSTPCHKHTRPKKPKPSKKKWGLFSFLPSTGNVEEEENLEEEAEEEEDDANLLESVHHTPLQMNMFNGTSWQLITSFACMDNFQLLLLSEERKRRNFAAQTQPLQILSTPEEEKEEEEQLVPSNSSPMPSSFYSLEHFSPHKRKMNVDYSSPSKKRIMQSSSTSVTSANLEFSDLPYEVILKIFEFFDYYGEATTQEQFTLRNMIGRFRSDSSKSIHFLFPSVHLDMNLPIFTDALRFLMKKSVHLSINGYFFLQILLSIPSRTLFRLERFSMECTNEASLQKVVDHSLLKEKTRKISCPIASPLLCAFPNLASLDFHSSNETSFLFQQGFACLKELRIRNPSIACLQSICSQLPRLQFLYLDLQEVQLLQYFCKNTTIKFLNLYYEQGRIPKNLMQSICMLEQLERLVLVHVENLEGLKHASKLQSLTIATCCSLQGIETIPQLRKLEMDIVPHLNPNLNLLQQCRQLRHVVLYNSFDNGTDLIHVQVQETELKNLEIVEVHNLQMEQIPNLLLHNYQLKKLVIKSCKGWNRTVLAPLLQHSSLEKIILYGAFEIEKQIQSEEMIKLAKWFPNKIVFK